jgi:hypothetical protein
MGESFDELRPLSLMVSGIYNFWKLHSSRIHFATDIAAGETDVGADSDEEVRPPVLVSIDSAVMLLLV